MSEPNPSRTQGRTSRNPRLRTVAYRIINLWPFLLWGLIAAAGVFLHRTGNRQIDYYGYFQFETSTISALEHGRIESIDVAVGEPISANQTLLRMDTEVIDSEIAAEAHDIRKANQEWERERVFELQSLELQLEEWKIGKREDTAELEILQKELIHLEALLSQQLIDRDEYVSVKAKVSALETSLGSIPEIIGKLETHLASLKDDTAKVGFEGLEVEDNPQLKPFEIRKARHVIRANRQGVVSEVYKKPGEITDAGEPVVQLMHTDSPKVVGFAPLSSIDALSADQVVEVVSPGRRGISAPGMITNISPGSFDLNDIPGIRKSDAIGYWFVIEIEGGETFHHREPVRIVIEPKPTFSKWLAWLGGL